jgi:hypothetical protein
MRSTGIDAISAFFHDSTSFSGFECIPKLNPYGASVCYRHIENSNATLPMTTVASAGHTNVRDKHNFSVNFKVSTALSAILTP